MIFIFSWQKQYFTHSLLSFIKGDDDDDDELYACVDVFS